MNIYDVIVVGAGPAGCQAAVSAAHQMRHVLVLDAGPVSQRKGRAYWSKEVALEDVPVFEGITGPKLDQRLKRWIASRPVVEYRIAGERRLSGIDYRGGMVRELARTDEGILELTASVSPLKNGAPLDLASFHGRTVVIASGFEDRWPDIEVDRTADRAARRYRTLFRYAGNRRGWHTCIRCDGHLHVDGHIAILGAGDYIYDVALGAQDFTDKMTILTNGRPHGMSPEVLEKVRRRKIDIVEEKIVRHIGKGTELLGLELADGRQLFFDGFWADEGLTPNTPFLEGWRYRKAPDGLIVVDEDRQMLDPEGNKIPGLFAAGDIVSGERKLIAAAFAMGQDAGLAASDSLRKWD